MDRKVKLGILSFAHVHATTYAKEIEKLDKAELVGVYDENEYRGVRAARKFGTEYFGEVNQLLEKTQGVVVASENRLHSKLVQQAATNGNHVLCEKPIATGIREAQEMIESFKNEEAELYIAFPLRFSPPVRSLKEHVNNGVVGELLGISSTNHGSLPPGWFLDEEEAGGGSIMDHTVHLVDLFRWIFQIEVREVYSQMGTLLHDLDVEDCGLTTLEFTDGSFATIDSSWSRPESFPTWGDLKMRVYGTDGVMNLNAFNQKFELYTGGNQSNVWDYWGTDMNFEMIDDFAETISDESHQSELASGEDGKMALETALACYRSYETDDPVELK